jgi:endonuclease YncB( thermonuclease family)
VVKFKSSSIILSIIFISSTICFAQEKSDKKQILLSAANDPCADVLFVDSCFIATYQGKVVEVLDGQTVVIILKKENSLGQSNLKARDLVNGEKVRLRLAGISAPTLKEKYAEESKQNLEKLLLNRMVRVTAFCSYIDGKEGWRAAVEYKNLDAGIEQIKSGFARYDGSTVDVQEYRRCHYELAEKKAKSDGKGIWQRDTK